MAKPENQPASVSAKPRQALQKHVSSGPLVQLDPNLGSLPGAHSAKGIDETANATLAGLVQINPNDPIEGMLAVQIISAHETALNLRRRAWHPEQSFVVQVKFLEQTKQRSVLPCWLMLSIVIEAKVNRQWL